MTFSTESDSKMPPISLAASGVGYTRVLGGRIEQLPRFNLCYGWIIAQQDNIRRVLWRQSNLFAQNATHGLHKIQQMSEDRSIGNLARIDVKLDLTWIKEVTVYQEVIDK